MKKLIILSMFFMMSFVVGLTFNQQPDSITGKDSYISQSSQDSNYNTAAYLSLGLTASGESLRPIFYFNLSNISTQSTVTSSIFQVYIADASSSTNISAKIYRLTEEWVESEVTWNNKTSSDVWVSGGAYGGDIEAEVDISDTLGWYSWELKDLIQNWVNGTYENYGFIIIADDEVNNNRLMYSSDYTTDPSLRPILNVTYFPNVAPGIVSIIDDSSSISPTNVGDEINFTVTWSDVDSDQARIYICDSDNINYTDGCVDVEFCSTSLDSFVSVSCQYVAEESDNTTVSYYVAVCDDEGGCSDVSVEQIFEVNHNATVDVVSPNGGETVNQSEGNYDIVFNVTDADDDNLTASIYFSMVSGGKESLIVEDFVLNSTYCVGGSCVYSWDSSGVGILGIDYWIDIVVSDGFTVAEDSSDNLFSIVNLLDVIPPVIVNVSITSDLTSGEEIVVRANVTDGFLESVWLELNGVNYTMSQEAGSDYYNLSYEAGKIGLYYYRIFANDSLGNINSSDLLNYNVSMPNADAQDNTAPITALPGSVILITGAFNNTDLLKGVYAHLNGDPGFIYQEDYPQNQNLGNISDNSLTAPRWFVAVPNSEAVYAFNVTYTDNHSNSWTSSNFQIEVTSVSGGGVTDATFVDINSNTEVEVSSLYVAQVLVRNISGDYANATNVEFKWVDSTGADNTGWLPYTSNVSTGIYNFTRTTPNSPTGQWIIKTRVTRDGNYYYDQQYWNLVGGLFDVETPVIIDNMVDDIRARVVVNNTGDVEQDLTLEWVLTRTDNDDVLVAASTTFLVGATSVVNRIIDMNVSYVGEVKLQVMGTYSGTLQAGSYVVFDTVGEGDVVVPSLGGGSGRSSGVGSEAVEDVEEDNVTEVGEVPVQLFDITFNLDDVLIQNVEELSGVVTFENFGSVPTFVDLVFVILDGEGGEVYREGGNITVTTERILRWDYEGLNLSDGEYVAILETLYGDNVSDEFGVDFEIGVESGVGVLIWIVGGIGLIVLVIFMIGVVVMSVVRKRLRMYDILNSVSKGKKGTSLYGQSIVGVEEEIKKMERKLGGKG